MVDQCGPKVIFVYLLEDLALLVSQILIIMKPDRSWMMRRKDCNGQVTEEFKNEVDDFIKVAKRHSGVADALGRIFCPCSKCKNRIRENSFWVGKHLYEHGFMEDYLN